MAHYRNATAGDVTAVDASYGVTRLGSRFSRVLFTAAQHLPLLPPHLRLRETRPPSTRLA